jgi:hypothetical protein
LRLTLEETVFSWQSFQKCQYADSRKQFQEKDIFQMLIQCLISFILSLSNRLHQNQPFVQKTMTNISLYLKNRSKFDKIELLTNEVELMKYFNDKFKFKYLNMNKENIFIKNENFEILIEELIKWYNSNIKKRESDTKTDTKTDTKEEIHTKEKSNIEPKKKGKTIEESIPYREKQEQPTLVQGNLSKILNLIPSKSEPIVVGGTLPSDIDIFIKK